MYIILLYTLKSAYERIIPPEKRKSKPHGPFAKKFTIATRRSRLPGWRDGRTTDLFSDNIARPGGGQTAPCRGGDRPVNVLR